MAVKPVHAYVWVHVLVNYNAASPLLQYHSVNSKLIGEQNRLQYVTQLTLVVNRTEEGVN